MFVGVFTLVDFYLDFDGLQPAFEEAQQQAAAAGGHYASRRRLHHGWTWVTPQRSWSQCLQICSCSLSKLCLRRQFLVAIKLVRAFLGIVEKWFWRLSVGAMKTLKWGENVDMLRLRSKSPKFWPKTLEQTRQQ